MRMILSIFDLQVILILPIILNQLAFLFRRTSSKLIFKMATVAAILDFQAIFYLQVTSVLSTEF